MAETYPAITIWQPWASLIAAGAKPFEFRSWPAPRRLVGRRVAIHAGARPVRRDEIAALVLRLERWETDTGLIRDAALPLLQRALAAPRSLPLSSVLCLATLGAPIRDADLAERLGIPWPANDSDREEHSNWGWPLTDIEVLRPYLPARGAQGWWTWERLDA